MQFKNYFDLRYVYHEPIYLHCRIGLIEDLDGSMCCRFFKDDGTD